GVTPPRTNLSHFWRLPGLPSNPATILSPFTATRPPAANTSTPALSRCSTKIKNHRSSVPAPHIAAPEPPPQLARSAQPDCRSRPEHELCSTGRSFLFC